MSRKPMSVVMLVFLLTTLGEGFIVPTFGCGFASSVSSVPAAAAAVSSSVPARPDDTARISGRVTDFENRPIAGASVLLKDAGFETVAAATSGADGRYSMTAPKGDYMALLAIKDYQIRFLEYWAWSVPLDGDLEINPRFDRLEVYAMNAWRPQGGYPSYQIYFRPMSLTRARKIMTEAGGQEGLKKLSHIDIAPVLTAGDIAVTIDGEAVGILKVNKVLEAAGPTQDMIGYVVQTELPKGKTPGGHRVITVVITDRETGEKGEGCLFLDPRRLM